LLKKDVASTWSEEAQEVFNTFKEKLSKFAILRRLDFNKVFILHTNWSALSIGAILGQLDEEGKEYVIAYASQSNNKVENNYSSYEGGVFSCCMGHHTFCALSLWHQVHFVYIPPSYQVVNDQRQAY
jgi:prenyltransferase beta subunit